jgi:16S rRNA (guanine527-N7)-methyltransferase
MEIIRKYFPDLSPEQAAQFEQLGPLYTSWNQQINVISRKDIEHLYLHHILHSLAVARLVSFQPKAKVLDLGTGGGLPGIPLAILFPQTHFTLIDARSKKMIVVADIVDKLGLQNVTFLHGRAEELKIKFDFVLARAVTALDKLNMWAMPLIHGTHRHGLPNGLIAFKGGNIKEELKSLPKKAYYEVIPINDFFPEGYFEEKALVYVQK